MAIPQVDALHLLTNVVRASAPLLLVSRASYITVTRVWKRLPDPNAGSSRPKKKAKKEVPQPSLPEDLDEEEVGTAGGASPHVGSDAVRMRCRYARHMRS